ncbi:hypothetical protein [Aureivirga sp. CE67]|uniref:hypothetical protein n=1 Tax=Aureivirga sp. CE67 TaxID=1788983 RepID=UPI0018CA4618|nr:hypothetical protein [Aureivirga sp. CE67]
MKPKNSFLYLLIIFTLLACNNDDDCCDTPPDNEKISSAFFVLNNLNAGNQLIYLRKDNNDALKMIGSYPTTGKGENLFLVSGFGNVSDPNTSQDAVAFTEDKKFVLNVNNNDPSFSVMKILPDKLEFVDKQFTNFDYPNAMATRNGFVYVLHLDGGLQGFRLNEEGKVSPIGNANHQFDSSLTPFVNVSINFSASTLVVTSVRNKAFVIQLDEFGGFSSITETSYDENIGPYGSAFIDDQNIAISNGFEGSVRIYNINSENELVLFSENLSGSGGHCWLRVSDDKRFAYVTNTPQGAVYSYDLSNFQNELPQVYKSTPPPSRNSVTQGDFTLPYLYLDLVYSKECIYAIDPLNERIDAYIVHGDGTLTLDENKGYSDWPIVNTISGGFNGFSEY